MDAGRLAEAAAFARRSVEADPSRYMSHFLLGVDRAARRDDATTRSPPSSARSRPSAASRRRSCEICTPASPTAWRAPDARPKPSASFRPSSPTCRGRRKDASVWRRCYRSQGRDAEARTVLAGVVTSLPAADRRRLLRPSSARSRCLATRHAAREWAAKARAPVPGATRDSDSVESLGSPRRQVQRKAAATAP